METNNLIIRKAKVADAAGIARIHVITWQYAYKGQMPQSHLDGLSIEERKNKWEKIIAEPSLPNKIDLVAIHNDSIVGFCSVGPCRDEDMKNSGEIWALYVDPNFMDQGVGSSLMERSKAHLRELGFTQATLWVLATNENSIRWYEHKGWKKEGKEKIENEDTFELHEIRYSISL